VRSVVLGRLSRRPLRRDVAPSHTTVNDKVRAIDKGALVAGEKEHTLSLLDSLAETASREVNLATSAFGLVVTQPVLKQRSATMVSSKASNWAVVLT
jgi:hypothetical protein